MSFNDKVVVLAVEFKPLAFVLAHRFLGEGARVVLVGLDSNVDQLAASVNHQNDGSLIVIPSACLTPDDCSRVLEQVVRDCGRLDCWINQVDRIESAPVESFPDSLWREVVENRLSSIFFRSQIAARWMLKNGGGVIVNLVSVEGSRPVSGGLGNSVFSAGVAALTRSMAVELAARNVRVTGVACNLNAVDVGLGSVNDPQDHFRRIPLGRPALPEEIAEAVVFLASDEAAYITGEILPADGGWSAYQLF